MRGVYLFDLNLVSALGLRSGSEHTASAESPLEISIVSLTPAAFSNYLLRTSPAPRARLACLLYALSDALPGPTNDHRMPPVVGIDIDITPIESAKAAMQAVWTPTVDERECHRKFVSDTGNSKAPTVSAVVAWALGRLTTKHCVVAIGFPPPADTDLTVRDAFIREVQAARDGSTACGGVQFASPDLVEIPHEYVSEYAAGLLPFYRLPRKVQVDLGSEGYAQLPPQSCSLGRVMGARLRQLHGLPGAGHCLEPPPGNVLQSVTPSAYEARRIHLGPARGAIAYSSVVPGKPPFQGDLLGDATRAFRASSLQPSDLFILTAESGTNADQFMVPLVESPVPGAWVHAAVALTEYRTPAGHDGDEDHDAGGFVRHVGFDLWWATLFALANAVAMRLVRSLHNEVLRATGIAIVPAAVLVVFVGIVLRFDAEQLAAGVWQPHVLVLLGMALHTYFDLAAPPEAPGHGPKPRQAEPVRRCMQLVWAGALWVFILLGIRPELLTMPWATVAAALVCGSAYLAAAVRWHVLPLPWRVHEPHLAQSLPGG